MILKILYFIPECILGDCSPLDLLCGSPLEGGSEDTVDEEWVI